MPTRTAALAMNLIDLRSWHLSIACPACRVLVQLRVAELAGTLPGRTMGQIVPRLRCSRCGQRPSSVRLADGSPGMGRASVHQVDLLEL